MVVLFFFGLLALLLAALLAFVFAWLVPWGISRLILRAPDLRIDAARLRWRPQANRASRVLELLSVGLGLATSFFVERELYVASATGGWDPDPLCGTDPFACGFVPWFSGGLALAVAVLWLGDLRHRRGRTHPDRVLLEPAALHAGDRCVPLSEIGRARREAHGIFWRSRTLIVEADPPLRIAADDDPIAILDEIVQHIERQRRTPAAHVPEAEVPEALQQLRGRSDQAPEAG